MTNWKRIFATYAAKPYYLNNKGHVIFLIYQELLQTDRKKDNGKMGKGYKQGIYRGLSTNS